jgi:hypothetical protein
MSNIFCQRRHACRQAGISLCLKTRKEGKMERWVEQKRILERKKDILTGSIMGIIFGGMMGFLMGIEFNSFYLGIFLGLICGIGIGVVLYWVSNDPNCNSGARW